MGERGFLGCGPQMDERGEYQHAGFCSGSRRHPRMPGHGCCCWHRDLWLNRLDVERHDGDQAKRTLRVAVCPGCLKRTEFPFTSEAIPRESFCIECSMWAPVETLSWDGEDFVRLLPVVPR